MTLNDLLPELLKLNREEMTRAIEILQQHIHQDMTSVKAVDSLEGATLEVWSPAGTTNEKTPKRRRYYPWLSKAKTRAYKRNAVFIYIAAVVLGFELLSFTARNFGQPGNNTIFSMTLVFVAAFLFLGTIALIRTLFALTAPASTAKPKTFPYLLQQPYTVDHQFQNYVSSFAGLGTVRFSRDRLIDKGNRGQSSPAVSLFAWLIGGRMVGQYLADRAVHRITSKQTSLTILYNYILTLSVEGNRMVLLTKAAQTERIDFKFDLLDGERFYRDLHEHYPQAVSQWSTLLEELIKEQPSVIV
jgi:hypothetical protein